MAERAGYDQPGDGYTDKHATFGVDSPPPYHQGVPPPQHVQQLYPIQQPYATSNTTVVVSQPQAGTVIVRPRPPDYMTASIFACLCCCWPIGLCAIYYANEANNLANAGDYDGASRMSDMAKRLIVSSVIVGILVITVSVVLQVLVFSKPYNNGY